MTSPSTLSRSWRAFVGVWLPGVLLNAVMFVAAPQALAQTQPPSQSQSQSQSQDSVWARAASQAVHKRAEVREQAERALSDYFFARRQPAAFRRGQALNKARRILERANAGSSPDPLLRYQLAASYYGLYGTEQDNDRLAQAAVHYRYVVEHPLTSRSLRSEAFNDLAIVQAHLGEHVQETQAYTRALELEPHPETRAVLLANRAEGFMVRGDILRAVRGYRESLAVTPSAAAFRLNVTTFWGLAVALDRSGNLDGALRRITEARTYDPADTRINGPGWFYVPSYDDRWYRALGHWQQARKHQDIAIKTTSLRAAIRAWQSYIEAAPEKDHWRTLATRRLRQCELELQRALGAKP